jgi:hypothetical protein
MATEEKLLSILVLLDFAKAFDSVDHILFCAKLANQYYAFSTSATGLIRSYPSNRKQWLNVELEHIHQWSSFNGLFVNPGKSQALVVNPRFLRFDNTQYLHLVGNHIQFYRKVKNLCLLMNDELTWDDQLSKVC